jgi:hypothetical protein
MSTTITINSSSNDCWGSAGESLNTGTGNAYVGGTTTSSDPPIVWMPFASIGLPQGKTITAATLYLRATAAGDSACGDIRLHAEATDNATSTPASWADLSSRSTTTANTYPITKPTSSGTQYSYDVTSIVQEILNRAGWALGNTLALMLTTVTWDSTKRCQISLSENATYSEPTLQISYEDFAPRMIGLI